MPYKNINERRKYQRNWYAERRKNFFKDKKCKHCGSTENLELHHRDPNEKEHHTIWGWSEERRLAELEKCDVLCHDCHLEVSVQFISDINKGGGNPNAKLTKEDVIEIRKLLSSGKRQIDVSKMFGVNKTTIYDIRTRKSWGWLK